MPDWKNLIRNRIAPLRLTPAAEADLAEELAQHLEDRYRELIESGIDETEASRQAAAELEDDSAIRGLVKSSRRMARTEPVPAGAGRSGNWFLDVARDLRFAGRAMRKNPVFVLFVVLTLGLGIGANTTVYTLINTLLLNPLPVRDSSRLAAVSASETARTARSGAELPISYLDLRDYQARNQVFDSLAGYTVPRPVTWQTEQGSERMFVELVTGNYFSTLGLHPARGRFFLPEEDGAPGAHPVAVLNYATWQQRFGGTSAVIGQTLRINRVAFTVIGVAPPDFIGISAIFGPDVWIPASMAEQLAPNELHNALTARDKTTFVAVGRLKPGVSREQAQADAGTIAAALARQYPDADEGRGVVVQSIRDALFNSADSGAAGILFGSIVLLVVVGIVLLIACSNVANLLLARAAARQHEIAVRLAIGASRGRLIRQLLTESAALGLLAGLAGLAIGAAGVRALWSALPAGANFIVPKLDPGVFLATLIVALATGFAFGTVPALRASRVGVADALREEGRSVGKTRARVSLANTLLVGQVAFSFLLLMTAALFLRSIGRAYEMDPGFQTAHLAVLSTNAGQAGYTRAQTKSFYKEVRDRVARMPGIASVAWSSNMPLWARGVNGLQVEGRRQRSKNDTIRSIVTTVDSGYFDTAGVKIESGRGFTDFDREDSAQVAIVNAAMAREFWPSGALGRRVQLPGETKLREIVGVARTANYTSWGEAPQFCVYLPMEQDYSQTMALYIRTEGDPLEQITPVEREIHAVGPQIVVTMPRTGRQIIDGGLFSARVGVAMLSVFGLLALALASIGLYGILAFAASRRQREVGLRMALGASRMSVLRLIVGEGMALVLIGVGIGLAVSLMTGHLLSRMLYGVSAADPLSIGTAAAVLTAVALLACYLPARWATHVDPLTALREG